MGGGPCDVIRRYDVFRAALKLVLEETVDSGATGLKFGLMLNHEDSRNCAGPQATKTCSNGGYILLGFQDLTIETERELFYAKLDALPSPHGNASHHFQGAELYFELFRFLTGQGVYNSHNGWSNFGTSDTYNIDDPLDSIDDHPTAGSDVDPPGIMGWDTAVENGVNYVSPLADASECSKVFAVNVMHQVSQQDADADDAIKETKANGGMEGIASKIEFTSTIGYLHDSNLGDGSFNENVDLTGKVNVTSYFIVDPTKVNTTTNGYAEAGGTGTAIAYSDDPEELVLILRKVLQEILGVSTTFVTTSVAANTLNRAQTLEALYVALFEPNEDQGPFWVGNVKRLMIRILDVPVVDADGLPVLDDNDVPVTKEKAVLVDANNATTDNPVSAINTTDGRISKSALTFWTDKNALPAAPDEGDPNYTDDSDGREVSRGGAGQRIPGFLPSADPKFDNATGRDVFTEPKTFVAGASANLMALDADDDTAVDLLENSPVLYQTVMECSGCSYTAETDDAIKLEAKKKTVNMIKFARGYDVPFDDTVYADPDGRDWWVADPLHSRPLILNFGNRGTYTGSTPDVRLLTAGNGGVLHLFNDANANGSFSGAESWAFLPRKFMPLQRRLMEDTLGSLYLPGVPSGATPRVPQHPYSFDASATALVIDNDFDGTIETSDNDKVYAFICMRRGGKGCYALDISNPDTPKLLWTLEKGDTGLRNLGKPGRCCVPAWFPT